MQLLPRILHAEITQPRHVRYLARDALPRTLEEKAEIHDCGVSSFLDRIYMIYKILAWRTEDTEV